MLNLALLLLTDIGGYQLYKSVGDATSTEVCQIKHLVDGEVMHNARFDKNEMRVSPPDDRGYRIEGWSHQPERTVLFLFGPGFDMRAGVETWSWSGGRLEAIAEHNRPHREEESHRRVAYDEAGRPISSILSQDDEVLGRITVTYEDGQLAGWSQDGPDEKRFKGIVSFANGRLAKLVTTHRDTTQKTTEEFQYDDEGRLVRVVETHGTQQESYEIVPCP